MVGIPYIKPGKVMFVGYVYTFILKTILRYFDLSLKVLWCLGGSHSLFTLALGSQCQ